MSYEVASDASFRVVRDSDAQLYYLQVGFGDHYRTFASMKTGKLDQMREMAKVEAQQAGQATPTPEQ